MIVKNKFATYTGYDFAGKFRVHTQVWTAPDAASAATVLAATLLTTAIQTKTTILANPDFPRVLTVTGGDGNVTGNVVITGTDIRGNAISNTIALSGTDTVVGTKAFKTVTSIQLPVYAVAGTETVSVGIGEPLGLEYIPDKAVAIRAHHNGVLEVTLPTIVVGATVDLCTAEFNSTCNGAHDQAVLYYTADRTNRLSRTA